MDASSSTLTASEPVVHRFEFRGKASEYFRIWIVNIALSIVTLGIYSAWAKVRARRYFYGNTYLNGSSFDYHGNPIAILKGRIIFALFFIINAMGEFWTPLKAVVILGIIAFPWLFVRGMIFNLSNSSYRGVRFGFNKNYKGAYGMFLRMIGWMVFTLFIMTGLGMHGFEKFRIENSRYGQTQFKFFGNKWAYWRIYLKGAALLLLCYGLLIGTVVGGATLFKREPGAPPSYILIGIVVVVFYTIAGLSLTYIRCQTLNFVYRNTAVGDLRLNSKFATVDLFLIYLGNFFACALTLGLAYPWARIELAKYRASTTAVVAPPAAFDAFAAAQLEGQTGSLGDQALDFWDIDLGF
jgi:uncharacterized membrane protein YjgN (DUF898 family)